MSTGYVLDSDQSRLQKQKTAVTCMLCFASCHEGGGDWVGAVSQLSVAVNMATASSSYVSPVCLCRYYGRMDVPLTFSAFIIAISLLLQRGNPRFAQLTSSVFGLFYCGYLPSFWVKLRCGLAAPALNTSMLINFSA
jgi:hypothetical protein